LFHLPTPNLPPEQFLNCCCVIWGRIVWGWATQWEADRSLESYVLNLGVGNILAKGEKNYSLLLYSA
jgi:hypothetical protein